MMKKNNLFRNFSILFVLPIALMFALSACSDDDPVSADEPDGPGLNVLETAAQTGQYSIFVDLVSEVGLEDAFEDEDVTLFAPSNQAFLDLPDGLLDNLSEDQIEQIILFHVISGSVESAEITDRQDAETILGELLLIERSGDFISINTSASVEEADLAASNGFIHRLDEVLLPSAIRNELDVANIMDVAREAGDFEILTTAVEETGLSTTLKYDRPTTVFAPTDDAFAEFGIENVEALSADELTEVLLYHVVATDGTSDTFDTQNTLLTLAGDNMFVTIDNNEVTVNASTNVIMADVEAENGTIHAIDNVLLPDSFGTIADNLTKNYNLSTLAGLLEEQNLTDVFEDETADLTLFAPTNDAFDAISAELDGLTDEEVSETLLYHVLDMTVESGDLGESQLVQTLNNDEEVLVEFVDGTVLINESSTVQIADVIGTNGVVHIVDTVLLPEDLGGGAPAE